VLIFAKIKTDLSPSDDEKSHGFKIREYGGGTFMAFWSQLILIAPIMRMLRTIF